MRKLFVREKGVSPQKPEDSTDGVYVGIEELVRLNNAAKRIALPKSHKVKRPQSGAHHSPFRGRGMEFAEVRAYQPGDDVRTIDWRVTARRQATHTKLFQEERERPVFILCDQSSHMFFGSRGCMKSVAAAKVTALIAWSALAHNDRVGGIVFSEQTQQTVKPARSRKAILRLLKQVESFNQSLPFESIDTANQNTNSSGFESCLQEACQVVKPGTLVFIVSDFLEISPATVRHVSALAKHNEVVLIRCFDPLELTIPGTGALPVRDGDDVYYVSATDSSARQALDEWNASIQQQMRFIEKAFRTNTWAVSTHDEIVSQIRDIATHVRGGNSQ